MITKRCAICNCILSRKATTNKHPTINGRKQATKHHYVAERFFSWALNRRGANGEGVFECCPWGQERKTTILCYECHYELLQNPVFLPEDIALFKEIVKRRHLNEESKPEDYSKLAGRVSLFHEIITKGLLKVAQDE